MQEGDTLSDLDIVDLSSMLEHESDVRGLIARHPELQKIEVQIIALYSEIVNLALENEKKGGSQPVIDPGD